MEASSATLPSLYILVEKTTPRLLYTFSMLFKRWLQLRFEILTKEEHDQLPAGAKAIAYLPQPHPSLPTIFANGLLKEDHIRDHREKINFLAGSEAFFWQTDIPSRCFHAITQYAWYQCQRPECLDSEGRNLDPPTGFFLHEDLKTLEEWLLLHLPGFQLPRQFDYSITIDIDHPWKHRHKPALVSLGGLAKAVFRPAEMLERLRALFSAKDPYDVLEKVKAICPPAKTKCFFLVGGNHPKDSRFNLEMPAYQSLIQEWQAAGFEIGLHPSYDSGKDLRETKAQLQLLESLVGKVKISRQHYLRYFLPTSFQNLISLGIQREYSVAAKEATGLVTGISLPYLWYDLSKEEASSLEIHPAVVMDRVLLSKLRLDPAAAMEEVNRLIAQLRSYRGHFSIILHNETFSDSGEWKGWLSFIQETVRNLQA